MSLPPEQSTPHPVVLFSAGATSYELIQYLGDTSNGELLLARRRYADTLGSAVIIKRLQGPKSAVEHARLLEEFRLIIQLHHPCIAQVYLVRMHEGSPHVVMEHVEGSSLEAILSCAAMRGQPLSEQFAAYVVGEVADGLHHAHTLRNRQGPLGVIHRDVAPRNIRLGLRGRVKLTDFAVAFSRMEGRIATVGPLLKGDIAYAAPEYLLLHPLDARSDLFSLGVVLLEMLTGKHLLDLEEVEQAMREAGPPTAVQSALRTEVQSWVNPSQMAMRMERFRPEHVERATRALSTPMRAIVMRLLRREPAERFQTALDLRNELWSFLGGTGRCYGPRDAEQEAAQVHADAIERHGGAQLPEEDAFPGGWSGPPRKPMP
ncbi:serine/threonine-protein kinase [Stigmatella aurantiaca]|uniref:non-specific serine/threonine protein kinase n=1 Tax=Stigmatella aurantiaca (strain DW4/3-1) TaxID=378806 RepID=Q097Y9_STIAD|nr:serine/threonine-protein kinase [Stigmatella aurantiaca]ADO71496.1 Serine/threonine kinase [Stigmatella aurantiaca DW4/3-1]EAU68100.1 serine/threonine kinase Pkn14 [Stigmatella aurantiaca DW4/3-1]